MSGPAAGRPDESERRLPGRSPPIRDAATLILLDRSGPEPRVLLGRRHHGHLFMPGKYVFPGGRIEPADRRMPALGALAPHAEAALGRRTRGAGAHLGRALALAALRETWEETGLMLGARVGSAPACPGGSWAAFCAQRVLPCLGALHLVARAVTPPGRPRRYDTRFFAADPAMIAHEAGGAVHPGAELIELVWATLDGAARLDLPGITRAVLGDVGARLEAGWRAEWPVPFYHERHGTARRELL